MGPGLPVSRSSGRAHGGRWLAVAGPWALLVAGCPTPTLTLSAPDGPLPACEPVTVRVDGAEDVTWSVEGAPHALELGEASVSLLAPVRTADTELTLTATGTVGGERQQARISLPIRAAVTPDGDLPGTAPACGPFAEGVASGDPTASSVRLWTRVESSEPVRWIVATDALLQDVIASGEATADPDRDWTVHVEATDLPAGTTLWYRFFSGEQGSALGRTATAPAGAADRLGLAVASCSSIFSGWFNPYRRLAERDDVDLVLHLGDFVYDFVDAEEEVRLPSEYPTDPTDPDSWRERLRLYLADPDQRAARAAFPWVLIWDNHDSEDGDSTAQGTRAVMREYVPMGPSATGDDLHIHRHLAWGDLVDLYLADAQTQRTPESILGPAQEEWLVDAIGASTAAWRVVGTQKLMSAFGDPTGGLAGQAGPWDSWPQTRAAVVDALGAHGDNVVLSGDLHFTIAADLVSDPLAEDAPYDPATGAGSVGVELLAAGISRGNFDESLCDTPCDDDELDFIAGIADVLYEGNPHYRLLDLIQHGYGVLSITPEQVDATVYYSPILEPSDVQTSSPTLTVGRGENRWRR